MVPDSKQPRTPRPIRDSTFLDDPFAYPEFAELTSHLPALHAFRLGFHKKKTGTITVTQYFQMKYRYFYWKLSSLLFFNRRKQGKKCPFEFVRGECLLLSYVSSERTMSDTVYVVVIRQHALHILDCFPNELREALRSSPNVARLAVRRHAHNIIFHSTEECTIIVLILRRPSVLWGLVM